MGHPPAPWGWSAPKHMSWVAGNGPVEPHTEVADHERVYDGNRWPGRARALDPVGGGACGRAALRADAALPGGGGRSGAAPVAARAPLLRGGSHGLWAVP